MRFLLGVVALALAGCVGRESSGKDTSGTVAATAAADERASVAPGAADSSPTTGGTARAPTPGSDAAARPTVLILGTSLTAGLGLDPEDAYPAVLQRMADSAGFAVRIVNGGLSGETSAGALRRLQWILRGGAAMVVVETGANDGLHGLDPDSTRANLTAIVRAIRGQLPAARVVLVQMEAPPNLGTDYTRRFREMYGTVARSEGVGLAPFLLENVAGVSRLNQGDGIHPTAEGAKVVARNLWPALEPHFRALAHAQGSR